MVFKRRAIKTGLKFNLRTNGYEECAHLCSQTINCLGWTQNMANNLCYLKTRSDYKNGDQDWIHGLPCLTNSISTISRAGEKKPFSGFDGEAACEGHNLNPTQCLAVGCCHWDDYQVCGFLFSGFLLMFLPRSAGHPSERDHVKHLLLFLWLLLPPLRHSFPVQVFALTQLSPYR